MKSVRFSDDEVLVLISCMFMCTFPRTRLQPCIEKAKMPWFSTFIQILTRDSEKP